MCGPVKTHSFPTGKRHSPLTSALEAIFLLTGEMKKVLWLILYLASTFCWIVLIEHGPDDFAQGCKIELDNFRELLLPLVPV
jgi:hypothetical protein